MPRIDLGAVVSLSFLSIAAVGAGAWIFSVLPETFRRFERAALALLGGLGLLSTALFLVGQYSFSRVSILLVLTIPFLWGLRVLVRAFPLRLPVVPAPPRLSLIPMTLVVVILFSTALCGLAEISGDWGADAVSYHLLGPKVWLRTGVIRPILDNSTTAFPQIPETLFATLWSLRRPGARFLQRLDLRSTACHRRIARAARRRDRCRGLVGRCDRCHDARRLHRVPYHLR